MENHKTDLMLNSNIFVVLFLIIVVDQKYQKCYQIITRICSSKTEQQSTLKCYSVLSISQTKSINYQELKGERFSGYRKLPTNAFMKQKLNVFS